MLIKINNQWDVENDEIPYSIGEHDLLTALNNGGDSPPETLEKIQILSYIEGVNDEKEFHWLIKTQNNKYMYLCGWCDYTGWGCQDGMTYSQEFTNPNNIDLIVPVCDNNNRPVRDIFKKELKAEIFNIKFEEYLK